jgi:hypothetical protein
MSGEGAAGPSRTAGAAPRCSAQPGAVLLGSARSVRLGSERFGPGGRHEGCRPDG